MSTSLVNELERLAEALKGESAATTEIPLAAMAEKIAKNLGVRGDEVAILGVSTRWRHLHFLVPQALKQVGFIPLTSNSALAARTVRDRKPEINNNFSAVRHATVFEGVRTGASTGESIQKIISAPILCEGKVVGVMQVSRKGATTGEAGPDFTAEDLGNVLALCRPLGKLVWHLAGE
ncbi:MAG TPA: GAF domain-containing protein [Candidatus Eisenbacteria bacterium]|nr:GAF domain-containing protein [Candidatus Eisenbacteria bacterium]